MAALDEKLGRAIRAKSAELRDQRTRMLWVGGAAASYALDAAFLLLFAAAGAIPYSVGLAYLLVALPLNGAVYAGIASGWSQRFADPGMVAPQVAVAIAMQLGVVAQAPQIGWPWLVNLFTVFAFGMIWLPIGTALALWVAAALGTGLVLHLTSDRVAIASELALGWLFFSLVLGRCVFLSVYAAGMRARLADSRRRLAESMEQIQELVSHDELTKTLNRRALMARLEQERARAERTGQDFCLALLDLDRFKAVNDTHGHAAGDAVLRAFAEIVHATMRETDVFGRYGGEEFMMILTTTAPGAARDALERIRVAVQAHDWSAIAPGLSVTVSAGMTGWRKSESTTQTLHRADGALYEAKHGGRNQVRSA
ncbi:MAG TPA: GGDEF domain-containing protein [Burkholderiales bacterium]|nr:GGDEF domain-containing protein [Burkholderiales bacterium]